jgi:uncharacterized membrane protein
VEFILPLSLGGMAVGFLYVFSMYFYYLSTRQAEISRLVPILTLNPIMVLIFATFLFHEIHTWMQYFGIALILIGILIASNRGHDKKALPFQALLYISLASLGFAVKNIITKAVSLGTNQNLNLLFWIGIGIGLTGLFYLFRHGKTIRKIPNKKFVHYFLSASLAVFSSLLYSMAIMLGDVSLVSFLGRLDIIFVFIFAESLDYLSPQFLQEKLNRKIFLQKLLAVIIILIGSYYLI